MALYGGVEAGGTKFVCAVGDGHGHLAHFVRFPTTTPEETLGRVVRFFATLPEPPVAVGVGTFGPADLHRGSPTYGFITTTPKPGWAMTDIVGTLRERLGVPVALALDVGTALLAEAAFGAAVGCRQPLYLTVGTGIGGALLVDGHPLGGLVHPEMGHIPIPKPATDTFAGVCPYHGDCFEGLASGPAIAARAGAPADSLDPDHPVWNAAVDALGAGLASLTLALSPDRIVVGGGVMDQAHLWPRVRAEVQRRLGGYVVSSALDDDLAHYLVPPGLGARSGVLGAMLLARQAHASA